MKYLRLYESQNSYSALVNTKKSYIEKLVPDPIDIHYIIDDYIMELRDKYGSFMDKFAKERPVIDFKEVNVMTKLPLERRDISHYGRMIWVTILSMANHEYINGIMKALDEPKLSYPTYGSDIDSRFCQSCKDNKIDPFYSILIGFEFDYLSEGGLHDREIIPEKIKETSDDLGKNLIGLINKLKQRYDVNIIEVSELTIDSKWLKKSPNISSLSNIKFPRIELSFSVKKKEK